MTSLSSVPVDTSPPTSLFSPTDISTTNSTEGFPVQVSPTQPASEATRGVASLSSSISAPSLTSGQSEYFNIVLPYLMKYYEVEDIKLTQDFHDYVYQENIEKLKPLLALFLNWYRQELVLNEKEAYDNAHANRLPVSVEIELPSREEMLEYIEATKTAREKTRLEKLQRQLKNQAQSLTKQQKKTKKKALNREKELLRQEMKLKNLEAAKIQYEKDHQAYLIKFEKDKEIFLLKLRSIEPTYEAVRYYVEVENNAFTRYTSVPASISNVCELSGHGKPLEEEIKKAIAEEKVLAAKEKELALEKKRSDYLDWLNSYKNKSASLTPQTIYNILQSLSKSKLKIPECAISTPKELYAYYNLPYTKALKAKYEAWWAGVEAIEQSHGKLIHNQHIAALLNIKEAELLRWRGTQIPIAETRDFRKWGQTLTSCYYSPLDLASIQPSDIQEWRLAEKKGISVASEDKELWNKLKSSVKKEGIYFDGKWFILLSLVLKSPLNTTPVNPNVVDTVLTIGAFPDTEPAKATVQIKRYLSSPLLPSNFKETPAAAKLLKVEAKETLTEKNFLEKETKKLWKIIDSFELSPIECHTLLTNLDAIYQTRAVEDISQNTFKKLCEIELETLLELRKSKQAVEELQIDKYEQSFPLARSLKRKISLVVGPTNSGKTHTALERLRVAHSGVYLAPLRLLALEIYEKMNALGLPCNLLTGEEQIMVPGAKHSACTVELLNTVDPVEVAVIDEGQMSADPQRGWAWTAAFCGVPAKEVIIVGSAEIEGPLIKLFAYLGENLDITHTQRKNELSVEKHLLDMDDIQEGDAVIAFSRKEVLRYASLCQKAGHKVSIIYGALSPEVRRKQAHLFASGEHTVLVATDAIGMGLNLPIKRVVFSNLSKYDGTQIRPLYSKEVQQIAGRAGRYGLTEKGSVGVLSGRFTTTAQLHSLPRILTEPIHSKDNFSVAPNDWHIEKLSAILKEKNVASILKYFAVMERQSGGLFAPAHLEHMIALYTEIKSHIKDFSVKEQYNFLLAPVSTHQTELVSYYISLINKVKTKTPLVLNKPHYIVNKKQYNNLEEAEVDDQKLTVLAWLARKFYQVEIPELSLTKAQLADYILTQLTTNLKNNYQIQDFSPSYWHYNDIEDYEEEDDDYGYHHRRRRY